MSKARKLRVALIVAVLLVSTLIGSGTRYVYKSTEGDVDAILREIGYGYRNHSTEKLTLCLDGVSWDIMQELKQRGHFKIFNPPSRVLSPFPSLTNVCLTTVWRKPPQPGYEPLYFDRMHNRIGGGSMSYLQRRAMTPDTYDSLLDYQEPKPYEFLVYVMPGRIERADFTRWLDKYYRFEQPRMRAFLKSSDGIAHIRGRRAQEEFLIRLDAILVRLYEEKHGRMEIALFSDHGNNFVRSRRVDLGAYLRNHGFRLEKKIADERSVVIPAFGLVGFEALYTLEKNKPRLAELLTHMKGVDFVLYRAEDGVRILGPRGAGRIQSDAQEARFRYEATGEDPLGLADAREDLRRAGKLDADGFAGDAVWFEALKYHRYPDAIHRLYRSITRQVQNPADILLNFKDGYFYGSSFFDKIVTVEATHGGLLDTCSVAFYMSTQPGTPETLRSEDLLPYLP